MFCSHDIFRFVVPFLTKIYKKIVHSYNQKYFIKHKLDQIISVYNKEQFPPDIEDLVRLHKLIQKRKPFTILEFGVGYSTLIMADALQKNYCLFQKINNKKKSKIYVGETNRFKIFSVDASQKWIDNFKQLIPIELQNFIHITYSEVKIGQHNTQLCHYYTQLPDIVPDFVYLDGPDPKDVQGNINGLSFQCNERTVMAADILLMEPTFLPGTFILVDGRTNNARFLEKNFQRKYSTHWNRIKDISTFELKERRLGKKNILAWEYYH